MGGSLVKEGKALGRGGLKFLTGGKRQPSHHPGLDCVSATPSARADLTTSSEERNFERVFYLRCLCSHQWAQSQSLHLAQGGSEGHTIEKDYCMLMQLRLWRSVSEMICNCPHLKRQKAAANWPRHAKLDSGIILWIRPARKGEGGTIRQVFVDSKNGFPAVVTAESIDRRIEETKSTLWIIAGHGEKVVGYGRLDLKRRYIASLYRIRQDEAKDLYKGTGRVLLQELERIAWEDGAPLVILDTEELDLVNWYAARGYQRISPLHPPDMKFSIRLIKSQPKPLPRQEEQLSKSRE